MKQQEHTTLISNTFEDAEAINEEGERLFKEGKVQKALNAFEKAVSIDPEFAVAHNNIGVVHWQIGSTQKALAWFYKALKRDPQNKEAVENIRALRSLPETAEGFHGYLQDSESQKSEPTIQSPPTIRILHNMARSGGTIIGRCLGCMDAAMLLSEVHPLSARIGGLFNALHQAEAWFHLFTPEERADIENRQPSFSNVIRMLRERAEKIDCHLVVRDWSHLDFTGEPFVSPPTYRLTCAMALQEDFRVVHTATVRHPLDQWLSLRRLKLIQGKVTVEDFLHGYLQFARQAQKIGFLRYEDFTRDPDGILQKLCRNLDIPFDPAYQQRWVSYRSITGDRPDTNATTQIKTPKRRSVEPELMSQIENNESYWEALRILGYSHPGEAENIRISSKKAISPDHGWHFEHPLSDLSFDSLGGAERINRHGCR